MTNAQIIKFAKRLWNEFRDGFWKYKTARDLTREREPEDERRPRANASLNERALRLSEKTGRFIE